MRFRLLVFIMGIMDIMVRLEKHQDDIHLELYNFFQKTLDMIIPLDLLDLKEY